ncbi:MAG: aspartate carbamoyltransferase catalytic subunit [Eubacteriales bacterium]|jgi:aspartate carbamoyltransferase catalytic subunit|nr:aspartate carbamoyltransferase catalytic subunit [Clostridia bacterium]
MYSLFSTKTLSRGDILSLLNRAQAYIDQGTYPLYHGTIATVFAEPSTRTNLSFQMAAQQLGLRVLNFQMDNSSLLKGETLQDTLETLSAMGVDVAVIRAGGNWPETINTDELSIGVINAGSGLHQHPTQALLDALTIQQQFINFNNLKITIVGDIKHSRVARSNLDILSKLGARVLFSGPSDFMDKEVSRLAPWIDFDQAILDSDVIMMLRVQHERHSGHLDFDKVSYHEKYGLTSARVNRMKSNAIFMHPGPVNRDVEIASEVIKHPKSRILTQVQNGVAIRMALLGKCFEGGKNYAELALV